MLRSSRQLFSIFSKVLQNTSCRSSQQHKQYRNGVQLSARSLHSLCLANDNAITRTIPRYSFITKAKPDASVCPRRTHHFQRNKSTAAVFEEDAEPPTCQKLTPFLLADIGEGIAEVEILQWFVSPGESVQQFDRVCEVQSDKATVEITSRYDGEIASLEYEKGDMAKVGSPLLFMQTSGDDQDSFTTYEDSSQHEELLQIPTIASQYSLSTDVSNNNEGQSSGETDKKYKKVQTSPAIRKLGKEHNLDLSTIIGTGPKGRVLKGDVLAVLKDRGLVEGAMSDATTAAASVPSVTTAKLNGTDSPPDSQAVTSMDHVKLPLQNDTLLELRGYNRLMVESMTQSLNIPHMVYSDEISLTTLRKSHLKFLPYLCKAVSKALGKYPLLNSSFCDMSVLLHKNHNLGIAMATPRGLVVPVIQHLQDLSISEVENELIRLKTLALEGTLGLQDLQGATFTLSNIGAIGGGGTYMSPIITSPQVAIGAIGKIQRLPRFTNSESMEVEEAHVCNISWAGDHRVVDGATMARFHTQVKGYLENPISILQDCK